MGQSRARELQGARTGVEARPRLGLSELYEEHVWTVYGFFGYRLRSRADAEDLTQLTFERAVRAWDRFEPDRGSPRAWLMSIANNLLIDHYRRDRSDAQEPLDPQHLQPDSSTGGEDIGLSPEIADALDQLTERERHLIALRFGGELTGPEISELTGLTLANVQQLLSRSLRKIRAELERGRS